MRRVWFACTVVRYCGCCFGVESHVAAPILLDLCVSVDCFQGGSRSLPFGKAFHLSCKGTSAKRASGRHIPLPNTAPPRRPLPRRQRPARCRSLVPKLWHLAFHVFSPTCMQRCRLVLSALAASACNPALAWNPEPRLKSGGFVELALPKLMHCSLVERERHASCSPPAGTSNCSFSLFGSELRRRWSGLGHLGPWNARWRQDMTKGVSAPSRRRCINIKPFSVRVRAAGLFLSTFQISRERREHRKH